MPKPTKQWNAHSVITKKIILLSKKKHNSDAEMSLNVAKSAVDDATQLNILIKHVNRQKWTDSETLTDTLLFCTL